MIECDMDAGKLFETMTVEEVKRLLQDTRVGIERKKEELRFLVGERYRDIIEAADTISEMKISAEKINGSLVRLNDVCQTWHKEIYLNDRLKSTNTSSDVSVKVCNPKYSVAAQVKVLLHMPELLWSAVGRQDHSKAAILYLNARHVFTHLQLGNEMKQAQVNVMPLATRQWNSLMQFRDVVIRGARISMRKGYIPESQICDALGSLVLLNDLSLDQVFEEYLSARKSAIEECANCEDVTSTVKQQVTIGLELLLSTICQIYDLFIPDEDGINLLQKNLTTSISESLINHTELNENIFKYLPDTISQFRPSLSHMKDKLSVEYIKESTTKWFNSCMNFFGPAVRDLIGHISALKSLNGIREAISTTLMAMTKNDKAWKSAAEVVLDENVDLWSDCLKPIFMERLEVVVEASFSDIFDWLSKEINSVTLTDQDEGMSSPLDSFDLNHWLWSEKTADVSVEEVWVAGARHQNGDINPLGRKYFCFTPAVQKVIGSLNERLHHLLEDLCLHSLSTSEKSEVRLLMTSALQSCLDRFLEGLHTQSTKAIHLSFDVTRSRFIFYSRLCDAMVKICPAMRQCFESTVEQMPNPSGSSLRSTTYSKINQGSPIWQSTCSTLIQASNSMAETCLIQACENSATVFSRTLQSFENIMTFLELCPRWDEIKLEGASVRVPSHASWHIHKLLSDVCQELNAFGAHNIYRSVLLNCIVNLSATLLTMLQKFWSENHHSLAQPQVLQLLFDVRFLFSMLTTSDSDRLDALIHDLESAVDPFDLDVASGVMQANLSQLCTRSALVYGLIVGLHDRLGALSAVGSGNNSSQVHDEHHLLDKCAGMNTRFVPLPSSGFVRINMGIDTDIQTSGGSTSRNKKGNNRVTNLTNSQTLTYQGKESGMKDDPKNLRFKDVYRFGSKLLKSVK